MPYKNPECKRQWEQQNRERRNANRRSQRAANKQCDRPRTILPNRNEPEEPASHWRTIGGIALGVGLVALTVFLGLSGLGDLES